MAKPMLMEGNSAPSPMMPEKKGTFFIPGDPVKGLNPTKGTRFSLEVVSVDPDNGDLEVRLAEGPEEEESPEEALRPMLKEAFPGQEQYG